MKKKYWYMVLKGAELRLPTTKKRIIAFLELSSDSDIIQFFYK